MNFDAALSESDFNKLKRAIIFFAVANVMTWISNASLSENATLLGIVKLDRSVRISDLIATISAVLLFRAILDWHSQPTERRKNSADIVDFNFTFIPAIFILYLYGSYRLMVVL